MTENLESGRPDTIVQCTSCDAYFPARVPDKGELYPVGIGDECPCGADEFEPLIG